MGSLLVKQNLELTVAKKPTTTGAPISQKDFEKSEKINIEDFSEDYGSRYNIADATVDQSLGMGSVNNGSILILCPDQDIKAKLVFTGPVQTPDIVFKGGKASVLHLDGLIDVLFSNDSGAAVTGRFFVVGD